MLNARVEKKKNLTLGVRENFFFGQNSPEINRKKKKKKKFWTVLQFFLT